MFLQIIVYYYIHVDDMYFNKKWHLIINMHSVLNYSELEEKH
jgi:hypothetical protein